MKILFFKYFNLIFIILLLTTLNFSFAFKNENIENNKIDAKDMTRCEAIKYNENDEIIKKYEELSKTDQDFKKFYLLLFTGKFLYLF